jgi:perosamine synthetase
VSYNGAYVTRFEEELAAFTGAQRAVAVVNGTAALHLALRLAGVQPSDEVLIPALTFVATANAIAYCGAVPHFVDSETQSLGIDAGKLDVYLDDVAEQRGDAFFNRRTGRCLRALVPVHVFGHPCDLDALAGVCERFGLAMVEDAAEALGSHYKGTHVGTRGRMAVLSFNGNKIITTGGGGAVLTGDDVLADRIKHLATTAKMPHPWAYIHDEVGYNYRMPNINAALGCAQLEQLPGFLRRKRTLAARYAEAFRDVEGVTFVQEPAWGRSNYWLNALSISRCETISASRGASRRIGRKNRDSRMTPHVNRTGEGL